MPPGHIDYKKALKQAETFKTGHEDKRPARRLAEYCITSLTTEKKCSEKQYNEGQTIGYMLKLFIFFISCRYFYGTQSICYLSSVQS